MRATLLGLLGLLLTAVPLRAKEVDPWARWPAAARAAQGEYERALNAVPDPARLRAWHTAFCQEVHPAGSEGERRLIQRMETAFRTMGLETAREPFWAYLPRFEQARLTIEEGDSVRPLPLVERRLPSDPAVAETVPPAWNAYSGSGEAHGRVVYVNYGTKADFETLAKLGITVRGRIVIARYGRNFRGFKAKFAEAAGAAGLLMYTDPDDSGYRKGIPYPEGGWANASSVQRGSIKTLAYPGDPLTPFQPATQDATRLNPATVALPRIPVQPIGWAAASEILSRMRGPAVPKGWQGGLPFAYRVTGDEALTVRLRVSQPRSVQPSANVIGRIRGARHPEQLVIVGCHFDAWTFGAGDPHAGSIVLFEMARSFAEAAKAGRRPDRTVIFANWGAEEYGIIGSTEWCEAHRDALGANAVAYVNLDMAAMGPHFRSSAAPALKAVIGDATRAVPQAREETAFTVFEAWSRNRGPARRFGNLGGGSDHVGFYCHLGVPACSLGAGGSEGVSYHTAYDTLTWYRQVVGDDYLPARMIARVGNVVVARLANAPLLPFDLVRQATDTRVHLEAIEKRAGERGVTVESKALRAALDRLEASAQATQAALTDAIGAGRCDADCLDRINARLIRIERAWLLPDGLPDRPWYRNAYAASDPDSGYAAWMLPLLRQAVEDPGRAAPQRRRLSVAHAVAVYEGLVQGIQAQVERIQALVPTGAPR